MENKKMFIYTLEDPITKEIRYVGKTNNLEDRYKRHLQKCYLEKYDKNTHKSRWIKNLLKSGNKPIMEILEECNESDVNQLEKYWISQFRVWGFKLTNISDGGEIVGHWKGKHHSEKTKRKISKSKDSIKTPIIEYSLDGKILNKYESLIEDHNKTGCHTSLISICCKKKKSHTASGRTFRYKGDKFDYINKKKNIQRKICKYDLKGILIETFNSARDAARS